MEGRLEEAQKLLEDADRVRSGNNDLDFDAACTRDNLGQLWEIKGDVVKAREARGRNPKNMICSNYNCPLSKNYERSTQDKLKNCTKCKCTWYCTKNCQKEDWKRRHKQWCKAPVDKSTQETITSE
ncbi:hypothetical protein EAE96_005650 [Botrytis aclada]|nr:hypothetical protein EAE96_005650 [Botrytis aclada]